MGIKNQLLLMHEVANECHPRNASKVLKLLKDHPLQLHCDIYVDKSIGIGNYFCNHPLF
jgi:hypothetical protein